MEKKNAKYKANISQQQIINGEFAIISLLFQVSKFLLHSKEYVMISEVQYF